MNEFLIKCANNSGIIDIGQEWEDLKYNRFYIIHHVTDIWAYGFLNIHSKALYPIIHLLNGYIKFQDNWRCVGIPKRCEKCNDHCGQHYCEILKLNQRITKIEYLRNHGMQIV